MGKVTCSLCCDRDGYIAYRNPGCDCLLHICDHCNRRIHGRKVCLTVTVPGDIENPAFKVDVGRIDGQHAIAVNCEVLGIEVERSS